MPATFSFEEDNGAGPASTSVPSQINWKNADDANATAYNAAPITAGNNSFEKWLYGKFTGTFNTIQNGFFAHTAGVFGAGLTLKAAPSMTVSGDALAYTTPAVATNAALTRDDTAVQAIGSGAVVWFSGTGPDTANTKAASTNANPGYTNYLTTQLQTTGAAAAGDTATATMTLQYDEN